MGAKLEEISISEANINIKRNGIYNLEVVKNEIEVTICKNIIAVINVIAKVNTNIIVNLEDDSKVFYIQSSVNNLNTKFILGARATGCVMAFNFDNDITKNTEFDLNGMGASLEYHQHSYLNKRQKHRYLVKINHNQKNTISNAISTIILNDDAHANVEITSYIAKDKSKSNAYQKTKIINLTDQTTAKVNPNLLIDDYDINGGHGLTVSKISDQDLYYLESRGIMKEDAKVLIIMSLLLDKVPELMEKEIREKIERKIKNE
ncbi:MAG: SufD family Fe-S cluster assembly protein [Bacilli bacterium]|nr:SufD family Fe-S cluster assembly protein [Bacilli bacterium]